MPTTSVNINGTWHPVKTPWVNINGTWTQPKAVWANNNGTWQRVFLPTIYLTVSANTTNYNIYSAAGSPTYPVQVILTINSSIIVGTPHTGNLIALDTGTGWASGTILKLVNNGYVYGTHGDGGAGGNFSTSTGYAGNNGNSAGTGINLQYPITIDNTNGYIAGGGGGGGGGGGLHTTSGNGGGGGGGGGGGTNFNTGAGGAGGVGVSGATGTSGGAGAAGTSSGAGAGGAGVFISGGFSSYTSGNGGSGGTCGQAGVAGQSNSPGNAAGGTGGAAGKAINTNGNTVTWIGGNNTTQVLGAVS